MKLTLSDVHIVAPGHSLNGSKKYEFQKMKVNKMLVLNVVDVAKSGLASPVKFALKKDASPSSEFTTEFRMLLLSKKHTQYR